MDTRKKLFCIIGETGSGKDTLVRKLQEYDKDLYKPVVSYTSRPKRDNETEGVEHYFLTKEEFALKRSRSMSKIKTPDDPENIVAYTKISASETSEGYEYMATLKDVMDASLYVIDPKGLEYLKEKFSNVIDPIAIYIACPYEMRKQRASGRSDFLTAFEKRVAAERKQFDHFYRHKQFDYIIYNYDGLGDNAFETLLEILEYELYTRKLETEYTSVLGDDHTKEDLMCAARFLSNVTYFYKVSHIRDASITRDSDKYSTLIRNLILSHLR